MERAQWQNLNGLWQYAIVPAKAKTPTDWQGEILVPFCVESSLSGVGKVRQGPEPLVQPHLHRALCMERSGC